jgi:hypothetical protein
MGAPKGIAKAAEMDRQREKREFIKELAMRLRLDRDLSNETCIQVAFEFADELFDALKKQVK